jgi:hypothetical protein
MTVHCSASATPRLAWNHPAASWSALASPYKSPRVPVGRLVRGGSVLYFPYSLVLVWRSGFSASLPLGIAEQPNFPVRCYEVCSRGVGESKPKREKGHAMGAGNPSAESPASASGMPLIPPEWAERTGAWPGTPGQSTSRIRNSRLSSVAATLCSSGIHKRQHTGHWASALPQRGRIQGK